MYREMDENGQFIIDCRLDAERDLDENIGIMIEFAHKQLERSVGDNVVKNRHEGYGLLAERLTGLAKSMKEVSGGMGMLLKTLSMSDTKAIDAIASIENTLADVVSGAVSMAAEALRINEDLYHNASLETTPLEDWISENADGFSEVDGDVPDVSLDESGDEDSGDEPDGESEDGDES